MTDPVQTTQQTRAVVDSAGGVRADAIIARRVQGRMTSIEDVRDALPAAAMQALRDYARTRVGDDDQDEAAALRHERGRH